MNVIPIPIIGMNTNTKEITENERKYKRQKYRQFYKSLCRRSLYF